MRRPEHDLQRLLRAQDVHWQVEPRRNRERYKTYSLSARARTTPTQLQANNTMQIKSIKITNTSPSRAFYHHLQPCMRTTAITILLTLSLASVLFSVAFATRYPTISAPAAKANYHDHNHNHHHHDRRQHNHRRDLEHSSYSHSRNHERLLYLDNENSMNGGRYESEKSRPLRIQHLQEQRRLRNLIAKTSSISKLQGLQHHNKAHAVLDKSPLASAAVQNLHSRRRYRFYDNEIQYPKADRHFIGAPHLSARLKTTPDQNLHDFSMHDEYKFWHNLGHDKQIDELDNLDSLDVDLDDDDDDDDDDEVDDDDDNDDDDDENNDDENLKEGEDEGDDEDRVPNQVDNNEENMITSHPKHLWKGFSILGDHNDERHPKNKPYHAMMNPANRNPESSPMIARAHHDDHKDLSVLHARNKKPWSHHDRHHVHVQPVRLPTEHHQQRVSQVPYQSPVVVSISDNSFVSASPQVLVGPDTNREQRQQQPEHNKNGIDARPTTTVNSAMSSIDDDDSLASNHILASNNTGSLLNITAYNRVETRTRKNLLISDHDEGISPHRKVRLLQPSASGNTFSNFVNNSFSHSRIAPQSLPPVGDVGVYTTQADQINNHREDETGSHLVVDSYAPHWLATNARATYRYELEPIATTTPSANIPTSSEVTQHKSFNKKIGEDEESIRSHDNVVGHDDDDGDDDDDETDKNDDDNDDDDEDDLDLDEDDENSLTIDSVKIHSKSNEKYPDHYSHIIASPNNELPSYGQKYWHTPHRASIKLVQEQPNGLHRGSINSAIIAILFGIGATGMLIIIVSIKMGSIRERVAYKGRRRSLVPDTDFLINTIPI